MASNQKRLIDLNLPIIEYIADFLNSRTDILRLSEMAIQGKGTALLMDICRATGATELLIPSYACRHIDERSLQRAGISIVPCRIPTWIYPQLWGDFIPNLSIIDMMFNLGLKARDLLLS